MKLKELTDRVREKNNEISPFKPSRLWGNYVDDCWYVLKCDPYKESQDVPKEFSSYWLNRLA